ncbi:peptidylprolyl isomerase [Geitlerinema sp. PCC 7407]|uniref:peptidylprolyl isomerase n=1 Tax=Geitlerinema sp. PCC 7407 TaxID=1173025 RepID=UPI00029F87A1|nr:PpiC-type peptidyl-prolyl cis-trans isomerase [Geitlerinema sp. PCC 7407]
MGMMTGVSLEAEEILQYLKTEMRFKEIYQKVLCRQIVLQTAQERGVAVSPTDVQQEADRLRRELRLEKAADTLAWLAEQMITPEEWEIGISDRLLTRKLAETLYDTEAEAYFAQNRLDYERIMLYQIIVPYAELAREIFYQIEEEEISFYEAAHLYDIDEARRCRCGYEGKIYRWSLKPDIAAAIFGVSVGEIAGPVQTDQGFHLLRVEELIVPELTPEVRKEIVDRLFGEWLKGELNYLLHHTPRPEASGVALES